MENRNSQIFIGLAINIVAQAIILGIFFFAGDNLDTGPRIFLLVTAIIVGTIVIVFLIKNYLDIQLKKHLAIKSQESVLHNVATHNIASITISENDYDTPELYKSAKKRLGNLEHQRNRLSSATENILINIRDLNHPLVDFLTGWYKQLANKADGGGQILDLYPDYYEGCLRELSGRSDIKAIADLTDGIEKFWPETDSITGEQSRIFIADWRVFFSDIEIGKLIEKIKVLRKKNTSIRMSHKAKYHEGKIKNFNKRQGANLITVPPDLVGGYNVTNEKDTSKLRLRVTRNDVSYEDANSIYKRVFDTSFIVPHKLTPQSLRRAFFEKNRIGFWEDDWKDKVSERGYEYFFRYDWNIHCWIIKYNEFIAYSLRSTKLELIKIIKSGKDSINVLEVGFGTGSFTIPFLNWVNEITSPSNIEKSELQINYTGIDTAKIKMMPFLSEKSNIKIDDERFVSGTVWSSMQDLDPRKAPYDIICSTLVLHDIVSENPYELFEQNLLSAKNYLHIGGRLIYADVFMSKNPEEKALQKRYWKGYMTSFGLPPVEMDKFLQKNNDMVDTISEEEVNELCEKHGFEANFKSVPGANKNSPFKVMILKRIS